MPHLPRNPRFWLTCFGLWFVTLWLFSSFKMPGEALPPIHHIDKVQHFGYFLGGSGLCCAWLFRRNPGKPDWPRLILTAVALVSLVGLLDEYHQSFTPGRSGNDPYDWIADFLGAVMGAFVFKALHRRLRWKGADE